MPEACVTCSVDGCNKQTKTPTCPYCPKHYQNLRRHGSVDAPPRRRRGKCTIEGCGQTHEAHGWCSFHYLRWRKFGNPLREPGEPDSHRFLREVVLSFDGDECLPWPGYRDPNGYGRITIKRKNMMVHRFVCEVVHGKPPTSKHHAAHSCGKGHEGCCNPRHLSWKTAKENYQDQIDHGTAARGKKYPHCRLTEDDVRRIRDLAGSLTQKEIAQRFNVDRSHVCDIINRKRWTWLSD